MRYLYAIYDRKADDFVGSFLPIHSGDAVAIRAFSDAIAADGSMFARHPEDFDLYRLGQFEGVAFMGSAELLITASQVVAAQAAQSANGAGKVDTRQIPLPMGAR